MQVAQPKKIKKVEKTLDKQEKICYNKNVNKQNK